MNGITVAIAFFVFVGIPLFARLFVSLADEIRVRRSRKRWNITGKRTRRSAHRDGSGDYYSGPYT